MGEDRREHLVGYQCLSCRNVSFVKFGPWTNPRPAYSMTCSECGGVTRAKLSWLVNGQEYGRAVTALMFHGHGSMDDDVLRDLEMLKARSFPLELVPFGDLVTPIMVEYEVDDQGHMKAVD